MLEVKLGVWGKDRIADEKGLCHAGDYYCVRCYSKDKKVKAEGFWPCIDPDIRSFPYCKGCITMLQYELMMNLGKE
ncbi:MAG: hypothetical protein KKB31_03815 [Nanoarchaeota archaeon]|nr:hypothetical protein [Nanoarchaeota archaeon]